MRNSFLGSTLKTPKKGQKGNQHTQGFAEPWSKGQKPFYKLTSEFDIKECPPPLGGKRSIPPPNPRLISLQPWASWKRLRGALDTPPVLLFLLRCGWALLVEPPGVYCSG